MCLFKRRSKDAVNEEQDGSSGTAAPSWYHTLPGETYSNWPKIDGEPEEPVFFKHCTSLDMQDEMLINMLTAYGIPAVKLYPSNGSFGVVVLGMSAEGSDIYVPASLLPDAIALIGGENDD